MAYVAISERLRSDVRRVITTKHNAESKMVAAAAASVVQPDDPRVIEHFWGDHAKLREIIPREWCAKTQTLSFVTTYYKDPNDVRTEDRLIVAMSLGGQDLLLPPRSDTYSVRMEVPNDAPEVVDHVRFTQETYAIHVKWAKVKEDVLKFLMSCKSLNEALKLWPDVRIYIPQEYLDKAEERTVKAKAAESKAMEILKSIDTDQAISSAVMVRILEANKQAEGT